MNVTIEYIERKFDEFNAMCFEGKLKPLPFKITNARTYFGQVRCKREKMPDGSFRYFDFEFLVSSHTHVMEAESVVEDVILHEMIHYYILSHQMQDNGPHGDIFKRMMQDINVRFNRRISVAHKKSKEEEDRDTEKRQHLVCIIRFRTNQMGVTVSTKSRLFELWDNIPRLPKFAECTWYSTLDPFFNRYPRATSLKVYHITREEIDEHLKDAKRLVREGDVIKVEK